MPDQQKSAEWNRGRYLVEGVSALRRLPHAEEHVWRRQARPSLRRQPASQGMFAPRLDAAERSGLKSWSVEDIAEYLQSGRNGKSHAGRTDVGGRRQFDLEDERCGYPRHRGLPEGSACRRAGADGRPAPSRPKWPSGEKLYNGACVACHEDDGSGAPRIYPPLPGNANLQSADPFERAAHHPRRRRRR